MEAGEEKIGEVVQTCVEEAEQYMARWFVTENVQRLVLEVQNAQQHNQDAVGLNSDGERGAKLKGV